MSTVDDAWVSWWHHDGGEIMDQFHTMPPRKMLEIAFKAGWNHGGGDERLAAIERAAQFMDECACSDTEKPSCYCIRCKGLQELRRIMGDQEVDE